MIALDTNVWARAILGDDPKQTKLARELIGQQVNGLGIFVPLLVFVELGWVLGNAPGWAAARVHQALDQLLNTAGVEVEASGLAKEALNQSTGAVGLADNLIYLETKRRGCSHLLTFDRRLANAGRAQLLK